MHLTNTRDDIQRLEQEETVTVRDLCDILFDLCEDVKRETGVKSHELKPGDIDELLRRLPWAGRILLHSYGDISGSIDSETAEKRLKKIMEDLEKENRKAESYSTQLKDLAEQQTQLDGILADNREKEKEIARIQEDLKTKKEENASYRDEKLPKLQKELEAVSEELDKWTTLWKQSDALLQAARSKHNNLKDETNHAKEECDSLDTESEQMENALPGLKRQVENRRTIHAAIFTSYSLNHDQLENLNKDIRDLKELVSHQDTEAIRSQMEQDKKNLQEKVDAYRKLEKEKEERDNEITDEEGEIKDIKGKLDGLQETLQQKEKEKAQLKNQLEGEQYAVDKERLETLEQQIRILSGAADALRRDWPVLDADFPNGFQELESLRGRIDQLKIAYRHHRQTYEEILNALNTCKG